MRRSSHDLQDHMEARNQSEREVTRFILLTRWGSGSTNRQLQSASASRLVAVSSTGRVQHRYRPLHHHATGRRPPGPGKVQYTPNMRKFGILATSSSDVQSRAAVRRIRVEQLRFWPSITKRGASTRGRAMKMHERHIHDHVNRPY
jgi:hypothetical protein